VKGDARLTGLRLTGSKPVAGSSERAPAVLSLQYSKVEGVVALSDVDAARETSHETQSRAYLNGALDVSWSTIDHLILDGRSLGASPQGAKKSKRGSTGSEPRADFWPLIAASATIRKLELRDPLPGQVDLADARVTVWDFGPMDTDDLLGR